jgi:hypothetical protein
MSMSTPMEPNLGRGDDGIPAADPGPGAPPPAEGFGIEGEDPDRPEEAVRPGSTDRPAEAGAQEETVQPSDDGGRRADPPFRTPDPEELGR